MARNKKASTYRKYPTKGKTMEAKSMGANLVRCKIPVPGTPPESLMEKIETKLNDKAGIETVDLIASGAVLLRINLKKAGMNFDQFMKSIAKDIVNVIEDSKRIRTRPGSIPRSPEQPQPYLNQAALATT